jgi:hypothetical protein
MKKHACIPAMLALVFLAGACAMPAVQGSASQTDKKTTTGERARPEKPSSAVPPETTEKRASLITKDEAAPTARKTAPDEPPAPAAREAQAASPEPLVFTDHATGLIFTYQRPWHLVSTRGEGPLLGRDGRSQLAARFATLTTDKNKGERPGYFYVPGDSLPRAIGKSVKAMLGLAEKQAPQGTTPVDVLLTQKHFPSLIIEKRYQGNDGRMVVQQCRHKQLPNPIQVYHIFIGDKVASFSLSELDNRQLKLEMQQIVFSTRNP